MQWTPEWVDEFLTAPDRALQHVIVRVWITRQGGFARVRQQMLAAPLAAPARRLLEVLLDNPGEPAASHAALLSMHRSTYYRQRRQLAAALATFLEHLAPPAEGASPRPPASAPARGDRLPAPLTPLIGREAECAALLKYLGDPQIRLISLIGMGGIGKTRVALEVAASLRRATPAPVWWVDLTPLDDPAHVLPAIARAVGVRPLPAPELLGALQSQLSSEPGFLMLDNAEHLLAAGPQLSQLLQGAAGLTLLVTSRAPLDLYGEHVVPLQPLGLPATLAQVRRSRFRPHGAMELFLTRARAANPQQALGAAALPQVYAICRRLDGLPLAIELAAAHSRDLALRDIEASLADRLNFLVNGPRDAVARQRTLRALLDWSFVLLPAPSQRLFGRLGVFHNGWSAATLAALDPDDGSGAVAAQLDRLIGYQMVTVRRDEHGAPRYGMLETVRAYAVERLEAHADRARTRDQHARAMLALLAACGDPRDPTQPAGPFPQEDYHNCIAALEWSAATENNELMLGLTIALWPWWLERAEWEAGLAWCKRVLAATAQTRTWERAAVLYGAARLAYFWGGGEKAREWLGEAAAILAESSPVSILMAEVLNYLALSYTEHGFCDQAHVAYSHSLALWRQLDRPIDAARVQHNLGLLARFQKRYDEAVQQFQASLDFFQALGSVERCAIVLGNLSSVLLLQGKVRAAYRRAQSGMVLARQIRTPNFVYNLLYLLQAAIAAGDATLTLELLAEANELLEGQPSPQFVAWLARLHAWWLTATGAPVEAITLFGAWAGIMRAAYPGAEGPDEARWADIAVHLPTLRAQVEESRYRQAWRLGEAMDLARALRYSRTLLRALRPPEALAQPHAD